MALVRFRTNPDYPDVLHAMAEAGAFVPDITSITLRFQEGGVPSAVAALLATWGHWMRERGVLVTADGDGGTMALLGRLGVLDAFGRESYQGEDRADPILFVPVYHIADGDDVFAATNAVLDLAIRQFAEARSFLPTLEWAVNEVIDNIQLHAEAPVPGCVCARIDPNRNVLDVGIVDVGRGICASLSPVLDPWERTHGEAIKKALQRGVTRDLSIGQGNGLAGTLEIAQRNGGHFSLWSGDAVFRLRNGRDRGFSVLPADVPGTGASFRLNPRQPVDLVDTFIGAPAFTFLENEAMRIEDVGGIVVRAEVNNTGTRAPARRLRNKAMNLLPDMEGELVLDFDGVERATSSFLDELLGRMAAELGIDAFKEKVRLVNLAPRLQDMANVVVAQRIEQSSGGAESGRS